MFLSSARKLGEVTLASTAAAAAAQLHLLQPPAAAAVKAAAPAASFTKLLYLRDAFAAGLTSNGESTCIADPPKTIFASLKRV